MDISGQRERGRAWPALATLLAVLGLLALAAVAARGDTPAGEGSARRPSHLLIDTLVSLYIVVMVLGAVLFVWLFLLRKDSAYERARLRREGRIRSLLVVALFLGGLALALRLAEDRRQGGAARPTGLSTPVPSQETFERDDDYEPSFALVPVLVVAGLGAAAAGALALAARRRRAALGVPHAELALALEDALEESLDDLRAEQDPRRAVVAAYARLERTLAAYGLPRGPSEAPAEYLFRLLPALDVSADSVSRLTGLFERAKFSQHAVGPEMKEEAIDALETTRRELREARERELAERAAALAAARERAAT